MGRQTGLGGLPGRHLIVQIHARRWQGFWKWTWMARHAGLLYGPKLPDVDLQPGREVGDVGAFDGGRDEEFPQYPKGWTVHQYRWCGFQILLPHTADSHRAAFSWRCNLWISDHALDHIIWGRKRGAWICLPWSVVICWGQPKRAIQTEAKALGTASVVISEGVQLVYLSMAVRQYRKPEETDSGPTRSIRTWEKCADGKLKLSRGPIRASLPWKVGRVFTCLSMRGNFTHSRPHKPLGQELDSGVGPRMAKAVEGVKDLTTERCGYEWPRLWGGCVTVNVDVRLGN